MASQLSATRCPGSRLLGSAMAHNIMDQPNKRALHDTVLSASGDSLYVWAGNQVGLPKVHDNEDKRRITSNIQHFTPSTGQWITRGTTGTPPFGVGAYCCTAINDLLYYFGGDCGHDDCYHNSITQLDTVSLQWRELEPTDATRPVMGRGYGGMISFEHDGVHHLLMIGGLGSKPAVQIPHYKYIKLLFEAWRTNEHSMYNISSREWSNPSIIGQCIPPASYFVIEKINNTRAVLFGGKETNDDAMTNFSNNIYILEISVSTVSWQCIKKPEAIDQWPVGRTHHAGAVIITGSDCPMLVISGGRDDYDDTLDDCWIFNITQHSWIKLDVPHSVSKRRNHSLSVFIMSPHCVWIITVGGAVDNEYIANPNIAMLTELVLISKGEWTVGDTLDTKDMNDKEYKKKYQQQLQIGGRIWLEEYQKLNAEWHIIQALNMEHFEREKLAFSHKIEQKEREEAEKDQEIRRYRHQLQEKAREEAEKEKKYHNQLQEKEKEAKKEKRHHQQLLQEKVRIEALKNEEIQQYRNQLQEKEQEIQTYRNLLQEKEREKAEMEQRYYWQLQENERKDLLKDEEMQRYHYQKKEIQKYIYQLQEKERKEAQQDQVIQGYRQQLQEKTTKQQEIQKYYEKLKEETEKETRLRQQLQEKEAIKEKEIQRYCQELQEKEQKEAEKEHQLLEEQRLKEKYFQQLQQEGKELAEKEKKIQMYHHQLQEKEREAQEKQRVFFQQLEQKEREEAEKEQEIRRYSHQLQEKDREEAEREEKYHNQLQEKDMELQDKNRKLQEKDMELQEKDRELQEKDKEQAGREEIYYNQLQKKDRELQMKDGELQEKDMELQEKDRELQEKAREEAERKQRYHNKLQEKEQEKINLLQKEEKEKAEIEQRYYWQLQENERKDSMKKEEMQRYTQLLQKKEQEYDRHLQEKVKEIQHYRYQLLEKEQEMQKYTYQLQEKERKETQQDQVIQRYCQLLQEKTAKEKEIQKFCEKLKEEAAAKEKRHCQVLQEKGKKEAEKKHQLLEEQRLKEKYFQQLQEKSKKLAGKEQEMQIYRQQLQDKEREEAKLKQYYNHELQKIKKELEDKKNEIQRLNHLLQNRSKELIERDQKMKELQQQIQQYEHLKNANIQERRLVQDKVQEVKLLYSSEEVERASESMISSGEELREDSKLTDKDDSRGNQMHESAQDEPKGVHVAANNIFHIHGKSAQSVIKWEEYGIRITIPQGAVLPSDTVQVTITALVGGDFIFPEDTELVSAVYAISLSKPFLEPVKLEIQHCVSIETSSHCDYLSFSTSTDNQPPYQFDTVDGGEFSIGNRYGSISIATFSKYCIKGRRYRPYSIPSTSSSRARSRTLSSSLSSAFDGPYSTSPVSPSSLQSSSSSLSFDLPNTLSTKNEVATLADKPPIKCYHSQVMYEIKRPGREWVMRYLLSKDLNALIEHIKKQLENVEKSIEVSFQFKDDDEFIELCFDEQCPKGWSVMPHQTPTRVRQARIDEYGSMSPPRFPECLITITATPGEDAVKQLSYPVTLKGIKESDVEKINIVLSMGDFQQASAGTIASNSGPVSPDDEERKITGKVLRENSDTLLKILAAPSNLPAVLMSFYAKELISDTTVTECMNDGRPVHIRCASLLFALKATIEGKPQAMNTLIEVLKENEAFKEIADKMDLEVLYRTYTNP